MDLFFSESDISDSDINKIIRPQRLSYSKSDLGPSQKNIKGTIMMRKDFEVKNTKQDKLQCSLYFPKNDQQSKLLIIYLHGNSGCRLEANPIVQNMIPQGYHVCAYDSSGCGQSEGKYVTLGINEKDDLHCVIDKMKQQCGYTSFILWGRSMGAVTSLLYCLDMQNRLNAQGNNINGVVGLVIDSAFSNFGNVSKEIAEKKISSFLVNIGMKHLRNKLKKALNGIDLFDIDLTQHISKLKIPSIFAYSDEDTVILPRHTHLLYENYTGPKQLTKFKGDHNSMRNANYFSSILSFINNYLKQYKDRQSHLQNIDNNYNIHNKMTLPLKLTSNSLLANTQQTTLNKHAQTQQYHHNRNTHTTQQQQQQQQQQQSSTTTSQFDEGFQQFLQNVNNQMASSKQMYEDNSQVHRTQTIDIASSSSPYNNFQNLTKSIENFTYYPSPHKLNFNYPQNTPTTQPSFKQNQNTYSQQMQPQISMQIQNPEQSFNNDINTYQNNLNQNITYHNGGNFKNVPNQSLSYQNAYNYVNSQQPKQTNMSVTQALNGSLAQNSSIDTQKINSQARTQQQAFLSTFVVAGQSRIPPHQDIKRTNTSMKRSQSTSSFSQIAPQQFERTFQGFNNINCMSSFINNNNSNNHLRNNTFYEQSIYQPVRQSMPLNYQMSNQILLK